MKIRVGFGFDVHRLVPDRELWLGGIKIDHSLGLLGHSDADVLIHAICDALRWACSRSMPATSSLQRRATRSTRRCASRLASTWTDWRICSSDDNWILSFEFWVLNCRLRRFWIFQFWIIRFQILNYLIFNFKYSIFNFKYSIFNVCLRWRFFKQKFIKAEIR